MHPVSKCVLSIDSLSVSSWVSLRLYTYLPRHSVSLANVRA